MYIRIDVLRSTQLHSCKSVW